MKCHLLFKVSDDTGKRDPPDFTLSHSAPIPSDLRYSSSQPYPFVLGSTRTAPAPSPNNILVDLSV